MVNIKVTYGSISRRLTISSSTTWSELESHFHELFNIPKEIKLLVSYIDEEGDVITLSSDLELQEVFSNSSNSSSNKTIKFILTTNTLNREKSIDTIVDEETSSLIDGVSAIQIEESNKHATVTDEVDEYETRGESSKNVATEHTESTESNNNEKEKNSSTKESSDDDDEHEIIVIITRNPWSRRRRERFSGCNPYYYSFGGRSRNGCNSDGYSRCNRSSSSSRGYGCGRYRRNQQISPEVVAEKINILNSMGFVDDNLEELVRNYNGNLEFIIEVLFNQRNEQNGKEGNATKEENDQPMEVEEERNDPYVL